MDPSKYSRIIQNLGNIREETAITLFDIVKLLFKKIIFEIKKFKQFMNCGSKKRKLKWIKSIAD